MEDWNTIQNKIPDNVNSYFITKSDWKKGSYGMNVQFENKYSTYVLSMLKHEFFALDSNRIFDHKEMLEITGTNNDFNLNGYVLEIFDVIDFSEKVYLTFTNKCSKFYNKIDLSEGNKIDPTQYYNLEQVLEILNLKS